jgi:hypothetical protein
LTETLADTWNELVTVGLLGTDRRDPPELPPGPLADTVADAIRSTPPGRLLAAVAATTVARRCGATPLPPRPPLLAPPPDDRPMLRATAVTRWRAIVTDWPVLEPEWLAVAAAGGWRPAPDVLVALLRRHHRSPLLAGAVIAWGGPLSAWLIEHVPDLAPAGVASPRPPSGDVRPLPVPADVERLLHGDADALATALITGLSAGTYRWSHRTVLLNVVARMDVESLPALVAALRAGRDALHELGSSGGGDDPAPLAVWEAMIELGDVRAEMLAELRPTPGEEHP